MNRIPKGTVLRVIGCVLAALCIPARAADTYPSRPIVIVVGFAPGGITDIFARMLGPEASKAFGQTVIVENKVGAAGVIASDFVARSAPDGYTLLMTANNHSIAAALKPKLKVDPVQGFTPITLLASTPNILLVGNSAPYQTLASYVAAAKAKPGTISFASSGIGTGPHFAGEQFAKLLHTKFLHVPYKGSNQSIMAAISGEVNSVWSAAALPQIKAGKLHPLGIASAARFPLAPDIPTFAEQGYQGMESEVWVGLLGPAHMPRSIAEK